MEQSHQHPASPRNEEERQALNKRLRRIEGQVRGIQKMVDEDRYCIDILTQTAAIQAALKQVELQLLERHMRTCLIGDRADERADAQIAEVMMIVNRIKK